MIDYDFSTLNDKEFENLSIELISKDRNKRFERFKAGKDGGIDGRFYYDDGIQEVVQCKHFIKSGFSGLISSLKKKNNNAVNEINKVYSLEPSKYIFITSLSLSAENKKTIKELFDPYIKSDNDIYGQEDLNQILGNNPDIEKRYYKLWLSSTVVLDRIFNNAIESRSEFLLEDIKENAKYYVITDNHNKAIEKLESSHIIIIAGEPGIGKTTLAEHMALWYVEKDFNFYNIENSINEAENIYKRDEKQIFYFDDFLGANYLNAIEDKKDSHIVKFMDRIKRDKTKRFILTSRTNIFNQGLALSDTFKSKNIESEEFIIKIESLKDIDKAMILYNHIWHSDLDEEFIDEIYIDKRYKEIINHKNFNPRLIAFITDIKKIEKEQIEAKDYWNYIIDKLDNPQDIWKNTFDKQCDEFIRIIVMLVVFNGNRIEENKLKDAYYRYLELYGLQNDSHISKEFDSIIEEVVKYFLNRNKSWQVFYKKDIFSTQSFISYDKEEIVEYSLFNPSLADFIIYKYEKELDKLQKLYYSLETISSLKSLKDIYFAKKINENIYIEILLYLFERVDIYKDDRDYIIQLLSMMEVSPILFDYQIDKSYLFFQNTINHPQEIKLLDEYITTLCFLDKDKFNIPDYKFVHEIIVNLELSFDSSFLINRVIQLMYNFNIQDNVFNEKLKELITESLEMDLDSSLSDLNCDDYDVQVSEDGGIYSNYDEVKEKAEEILSNLISGIKLINGLTIDKEKILERIDLEQYDSRIIDDYCENYIVEQPMFQKEVNYINTLEELFER